VIGASFRRDGKERHHIRSPFRVPDANDENSGTIQSERRD